jgi:Raf kinase inhibitor-like YbhB/YbcL family protein
LTPPSKPESDGLIAIGQKGDVSMALVIKSTAFAGGETIPKRYTEDGEDISPPLTWTGLPPTTKEIALICDDPDAPTPQPWVHWVIYKIPPATAGLPEHVSTLEKLSEPVGAVQGKNSWRGVGYRGPAPPHGHGTHHYHFRLYALDAPLNAAPGLDKDGLLVAMKGHILAQSELMGTYER